MPEEIVTDGLSAQKATPGGEHPTEYLKMTGATDGLGDDGGSESARSEGERR